MTATTKEQRERWRRAAGTGECGLVQVTPAELRALLSDAEEADALRELVRELEAEVAQWEIDYTPIGLQEAIEKRAEAAESERDTLRRLLTETAVPALEAIEALAPEPYSFPPGWDEQINACPDCQRYEEAEALRDRVAEQAEEIDRLKARAQEVWGERNKILRDSGYEQFDLIKRVESAEAERDTLRRLLTETAVPALDAIGRNSTYETGYAVNCRFCDGSYGNHDDGCEAVKVGAALSTIRAQMECGKT